MRLKKCFINFSIDIKLNVKMSVPDLSEYDKTLIIEHIIPFYNTRKHLDILKMMISPENTPKKRDKIPEELPADKPIPLRVIEYTCIRYACDQHAFCEILQPNGEKVQKNLKTRYSSVLAHYSKKRFDVYGRTYKPNYFVMDFELESGEVITSTIAQLNFFKWAIAEGILDFIRKNYRKIKDHMRKNLENKTEKTKRKRVTQKVFAYPKNKDGKGFVIDFSL